MPHAGHPSQNWKQSGAGSVAHHDCTCHCMITCAWCHRHVHSCSHPHALWCSVCVSHSLVTRIQARPCRPRSTYTYGAMCIRHGKDVHERTNGVSCALRREKTKEIIIKQPHYFRQSTTFNQTQPSQLLPRLQVRVQTLMMAAFSTPRTRKNCRTYSHPSRQTPQTVGGHACAP